MNLSEGTDVEVRHRAPILVKALESHISNTAFPLPTEIPSREFAELVPICHNTMWAIWFVLAHEYAHHALGHLNAARSNSHATGTTVFEVVQYAHYTEYEADLWAFDALLRMAKTLPNEISEMVATIAPFFFLGLLLLIEEAERRRGTESASHPRSVDRYWMLMRHIRHHEFLALPRRDSIVVLISETAKLMFGGPLRERSDAAELERIYQKTSRAVIRRTPTCRTN